MRRLSSTATLPILTGALATLALAAALGSAAAASARTFASSSATQAPARKAGGGHAKASELWATVDLCNTPLHPDTIGIRGSMPGDGHRHDTMYMRFVVQNYDVSAHKWQNIGVSADSGFVLVGSAGSTRQAGHSFGFKPTTTTFTLRGLVEFQWHRAGHTLRTQTLPTTGGHKSLAGSEPNGFSAATCNLP